MQSKPIFLYKITNEVNGKCYVGQTNNLTKRFSSHRCGYDKRGLVGLAIKKYGLSHFKFEIIEQVMFREVADELEKYYIDELNTMVPNGYNLSTGGQVEKEMSDETKKKISLSCKGKRLGEKSPRFGKHHTEETIKKIKEKRKKQIITDEHKRKISMAFRGKKLSDEHKKNLSLSLKGKLRGDRHPNWGKHRSQETRDRIGNANRNRKFSQEMKEAMRKKRNETKALNLVSFIRDQGNESQSQGV